MQTSSSVTNIFGIVMDSILPLSSTSVNSGGTYVSNKSPSASLYDTIAESSERENNRKTSCTERQQFHSLLQQCSDVIADEDFPLCFQAKRHQESIEGVKYDRQHWRIKERMKTASVALVLCLNIGVDPPDVVKVQPCSKLECWIDPSSVSPAKAMDMIGANLQAQYERWQPRARYKKCHDPTVEDVKKLCTSLRRNAKGERILFHYNGHGVPKPTANGEIWVFNKSFTQYIPLSIFELQNWMTAPSIYVYDCSNAGIIIQSFLQFAEQQEREMEKTQMTAKKQRNSSIQLPAANIINYRNCIHLAACSINEILPMNAQLPADLFTSCLTTPINIALQWHTMRENFDLTPRLYSDFIDKIPGKVNDRRTMMGELNWIFTAITDTIAWNILPRELFQRLFRQDLLVASLFRNFLLAERILRSHNCTPISHPSLPQCFRHHMWTAWDLVVDLALRQLPDILERGMLYKQLPFFEEQLTAFQVWLDREAESRNPPEQLPIVLQVLLSQVHRLRALELLARFLDLGPWAVNQALGVGIFPYVLKLLQSSARELRPVLVFIWAKILAIDPTCQVDLVKEHKYFVDVLQDATLHKKYRTLSAFVLACIVNNFLMGQSGALQGSLVSICLEQLNDDSWLLRQWLAICLGKLWQNFEKARWSGVRDLAHEKLYTLLKDPIPEVRAAAVYALGTFISSVTDRSEEHANKIDRIIAITLIESAGEDMSPLVRGELAAALQWMVLLFESQFVAVYMQEYMFTSVYGGERSSSVGHVMAGTPVGPTSTHRHHHSTHSLERHVSMRRGVSSNSISSINSSSLPFHSIFVKLWQGIYQLGHDPYPQVAKIAQKIIAYVRDVALCLITAKEVTTNEKGINLSVSLPPSPNAKISYMGCRNGGGGGESPSSSGESHDINQSNASQWLSKLRTVPRDPHNFLHQKVRSSSMHDEVDSALLTTMKSNISYEFPGNCNTGGDSAGCYHHHIHVNDNNYEMKKLEPIVETGFISWAISYFSKPGKYRYSADTESERIQTFPIDRNCPELRARECRLQRNRQIRRHAMEQQLRTIRIDHQCWMRKTQSTPSIVKLVPYESQIAVAYREKVRMYDWQYNTVRTFTPVAMPLINRSPMRVQSSNAPINQMAQSETEARVSAIEFLNAQDAVLTLVGYEDGVVRIWQPNPIDITEEGSRESSGRLMSAWVALPTLHASYIHRAGNIEIGSASKQRKDLAADIGLLTAWQQSTQQLVVTGGTNRYIRIWDIERELRLCDIPIGKETNITVLSSFPNNLHSELIATGCLDGSVRIYDKRCSPHDARVRFYREHHAPILCACLKDDQITVITGCSGGIVCILDLRLRSQISSINEWVAGNDVTAIAAHQSADYIACGSPNKIAIYSSQSGARAQNNIRTHESFMTPKISHPTCLAFHSHRPSLAAGFLDNTVAVYEQSPGIAKLQHLHYNSAVAKLYDILIPCRDRPFFFCTLFKLQTTNMGIVAPSLGTATIIELNWFRTLHTLHYQSNRYKFLKCKIQFYKLCNRWRVEVDKNPQTFDNVRKFLEGKEMLTVLKQVQSKLQDFTLNIDDIRLIYTACAFETAWKRHQKEPSVWCQLFDNYSLKILEYAKDLEYYWNDGYGYELTHRIACPTIGDLFKHIEPQSSLPNATFYFTHSGTLLKLIAHLGLYKDESPLTYKNIHEARNWRTSLIDSFATNLAFVLYECDNYKPMVLTLHQERIISIPGCPKNSDLCSLETLRQLFWDSIENCNFNEMCIQNEK